MNTRGPAPVSHFSDQKLASAPSLALGHFLFCQFSEYSIFVAFSRPIRDLRNLGAATRTRLQNQILPFLLIKV